MIAAAHNHRFVDQVSGLCYPAAIMSKCFKRVQLVVKVGIVTALIAACAPAEQEDAAPETSQVQAANAVNRLLTYQEAGGESTDMISSDIRLDLGEVIVQVGEPTTRFNRVTERDEEFILVETEDGDQVYHRAFWFLADSQPAVVISDEAVVYTRPEVVGATGNQIARGQVLAATVIEGDDAGVSFVEVLHYDHDAQTALSSRYLRDDVISTDANDVRAAILLFVAGGTEDAVARREILRTASDLPNNQFRVEVREALAAVEAELDPDSAVTEEEDQAQELEPVTIPAPGGENFGAAADLGIATEEFGSQMVANADDVTVYAAPSQDSAVVATLESGQTVIVTARTVDTFSVDDSVASWMFIDAPNGWVFGIYLDPQ